jgi:ornithine cyclodeaminase/alanine dehydrogenase-like protein (mu-crystallin family)
MELLSHQQDVMRIRFLTGRMLTELLSFDEVLGALRESCKILSASEATVPPRAELPTEQGDILFVMPAHITAGNLFGVKVAHWRPSASGSDPPALLMVFSGDNSGPVGVLDARDFSDLRTSGVSAVAVDVLARRDGRKLALFGAGRQARAHAIAIHKVRPLDRVSLFSRTRDRAVALADELRRILLAPRPLIETADSPSAAIRDADIIVTATTSPEPVFDEALLSPGAHVCAVGAHDPARREVDVTRISEAKVVVDHRDSCVARAGEVAIPIRAQGLSIDRIVHAELGEILSGDRTGREGDTEITVFKSLGNAVNDVVLAKAFLDRAVERGVGEEYEM